MKMSSLRPSSLIKGYLSLWCLFFRYASSFFEFRIATCEVRAAIAEYCWWLVVRGSTYLGCADGETTDSKGT